MTAAPRWGATTPGAWTPYAVTVRNDGPTDLVGDIVLVPATDPPSAAALSAGPGRPGGPPTTLDPDSPAASQVVALGQTEYTVRRAPMVLPSPGDHLTYRSKLTVAVGGEKRLEVLVVEAPYGYRAEVHDQGGRRIAASAGAQAAAGPGATVAIASQVPGADATLGWVPGFSGPASVTTLAAPGDLPDTALQLSGLRLLVIAGFDTGSLTPAQVQAVLDYVTLGGSLVLGGGASGARALSPLPDELVPLRPTGTATVPLAALADLVGRTTTATTTVVTGELRRGRLVLSTREGVPLVVQAELGAGRVLQLAYDPLAEPFPADPALRDLAWQQGIARAVARINPELNELAPPGQLWSSALERPAWPAWPNRGLGLLAAYAVLSLPLGYALLRLGRRPQLVWLVVPALSAAMVASTLTGDGARHGNPPPAVEVHQQGPGDTVLVTSYGGHQALGREDQRVVPGPGAAVSSVFTPPGLVAAARPDLSRPAAGGGVVTSVGSSASVSLRSAPGDVRNLHVVSLGRQPGLSSRLRLMGSDPPDQGGVRIAGTVTNRSPRPIRGLRAQLPEGAVARLADVILPGQTLAVDASMVWPQRTVAGNGLVARPEELVMFAAASEAFTRPGQAVVVGTQEPRPGPPTLALALEVVPLDSSQNLVAATGDARLVARTVEGASNPTSVFELGGLPGIGPVNLVYGTYLAAPEVQDATTGAWRLLPPGDQNAGVVDTTPLTPGEAADGLVRIRWRGSGPVGFRLEMRRD